MKLNVRFPLSARLCVLDVLILAICTAAAYSNRTLGVINVPCLSLAKVFTRLTSKTSERQKEFIVQTHHHL